MSPRVQNDLTQDQLQPLMSGSSCAEGTWDQPTGCAMLMEVKSQAGPDVECQWWAELEWPKTFLGGWFMLLPLGALRPTVMGVCMEEISL